MGNLDDVKIICVGFDVSAEIKENILIVFKKLLDEAPSDSFMKVNISKVSAGFEGRVIINSITGIFTSSQLEMTPYNLVSQLATGLREQLIDWKSKRFLTEITA